MRMIRRWWWNCCSFQQWSEWRAGVKDNSLFCCCCRWPDIGNGDVLVVDSDDQGDKWKQKTAVVVGVGSLSWQVESAPPLTLPNGPFRENQVEKSTANIAIVLISLPANWCHFLPNCGLVADQSLTINLKTLPFVFSPNCTCQTASEEKDKTATSRRKCSFSEILKWGRLVTRVHETCRLWGSGEGFSSENSRNCKK